MPIKMTGSQRSRLPHAFETLAAQVRFPPLSGVSRRTGHLSADPSCVRYFFAFDLVGFIVQVLGKVAEFPLGLYVFGAVGNVATLGGATAE